jgi:hypothetical protein
MAWVACERRAAVAVAALVATFAPDAGAQDDVVRIEYRAPDGCPSEQQFLDEVSRRAARSRLARPGEIARTFMVTVSTNESGSSARLEITDSDRPIREVHAKNCAEAAHAIALVTALAMDARAAHGDDVATAPPAPTPRPPPVSDGVPPSPAPEAPKVDRTAAPDAPEVDRAPSEPESAAGRPPTRWEVGGQFVWHSPIAPGGALGGALFAGRVAADDGFSLRGTLLYVESGSIEAEQGGARVSLMAARFDGCAPAVGMKGRFTLRPCLAVEGGRLRGEGQEGGAIIETTTTNDMWLATGVLLRLGGIFGDIFLVEAEGGPWFPITRTEFRFRDPEIAIHETQGFGLVLGAGAGFVFR